MDARNIKAIRNTGTDQLYSIGDVCNRIDSIRTDMTHELLVSFSQSTDLVPVQVYAAISWMSVFRRGMIHIFAFSGGENDRGDPERTSRKSPILTL